VEIYGGALAINNNVQTSALGAKVLFKSTGNITLDASRSVITNGGDITLWADSDASGAGGISIKTGATLDARRTVDRTSSLTSDATGGGAITLAGGLDDGGVASGASSLINGLVASDGRPDGYAVDYGGSSIQYGVMLGTEGALATQNANIKLYSGGGDIRLNGRVTTVVGGGGNGPTGLVAFQGVNMDAGVEGDLRLLGNAAVTTQYPIGMDLQGWRLWHWRCVPNQTRRYPNCGSLIGRHNIGCRPFCLGARHRQARGVRSNGHRYCDAERQSNRYIAH
jgi:hypothetical protein